MLDLLKRRPQLEPLETIPANRMILDDLVAEAEGNVKRYVPSPKSYMR